MVWAQPHIPHVHTYTEAERIPVISTQTKTKTKAARQQSDQATQSDPFFQKPRKTSRTHKPKPRAEPATLRPKTSQNKPPNVTQSISHVPASSTQASKHRGYCSFIAVSSSGVGNGASLGRGASLDPGCCCCSTSLRASARKAEHDRSVALCGCWDRAQQSGGCTHRRPFGQPGMSHRW
jgi:hypothetical protein